MKYDRLWERLLESLNAWAHAEEAEAGHITVTLTTPDSATRTVEILMSREDWDEMVTIPWVTSTRRHARSPRPCARWVRMSTTCSTATTNWCRRARRTFHGTQ